MKLEIIARDLYDIELINRSNADRIEFCSNLQVGGLTPTFFEIKNTFSKIPVNVMIRETNRDFIYSEDEMKLLLNEIEFCGKSNNISGVVFGMLTKENDIDIKHLKTAVSLAKEYNMTVTFHKAFDLINDFEEGYKILCDLKIDYVLTACGSNIIENITTLNKLKNIKGHTKILGGGGINSDNIDKVKDVVDEIHLGTLARENNSFNYPVDVLKINKLKKLITGG
ncbi:copper homeostasis protein CutC [Spiroplasma endosymbiont of Aspidapion aeneum]|uniref:copper homeostasis protein CutC n=1 Tax=Spiroplasma endosymbiont of Aspidapion aeneum TaxID=3066276 RepID=UPI00313CF0F4